jgi:hypothetical protein
MLPLYRLRRIFPFSLLMRRFTHAVMYSLYIFNHHINNYLRILTGHANALLAVDEWNCFNWEWRVKSLGVKSEEFSFLQVILRGNNNAIWISIFRVLFLCQYSDVTWILGCVWDLVSLLLDLSASSIKWDFGLVLSTWYIYYVGHLGSFIVWTCCEFLFWLLWQNKKNGAAEQEIAAGMRPRIPSFVIPWLPRMPRQLSTRCWMPTGRISTGNRRRQSIRNGKARGKEIKVN